LRWRVLQATGLTPTQKLCFAAASLEEEFTVLFQKLEILKLFKNAREQAQMYEEIKNLNSLGSIINQLYSNTTSEIDYRWSPKCIH
jgi:hypothetical protein